ncbi:proteoglycan 4-like isoform X2 [Schistocerca gregaria]|uniref:proteoglycan 4-like isoform X2 n=1 Tax=Schistocerca gregaria TaxID=7010 RepID=UPI00211DD5F9|nr:proteoglycan 4-like isoform X2 [Schistocerca gregaria]
MLLQWTLLQLASLGIDDSKLNKNGTGVLPNLRPLIGASPIINPPALLSQLLLPNAPAEISPPAQAGCPNRTSEATAAPEPPPTTSSEPTTPTPTVVTTVSSTNGSELKPSAPEVTTAAAATTTSAPEPTTPTPTLVTTVSSTNGSQLKPSAPEVTTAAAAPTTPAPVPETTSTSEFETYTPIVTTQPSDGSTMVVQGGVYDSPEATTASALQTTPASEPITPTPTLLTTVSSMHVSELKPSAPELTTAAVAPTTSAPVSETTPGEPTVDTDVVQVHTEATSLSPPTVSTEAADSTTETPNELIQDTVGGEHLPEKDAATVTPTQSTTVSELPTTTTQIPPSQTAVPTEVPTETENNEATEFLGNEETDSTPELLPETESPPVSSLTPAPAPENLQEIPPASVTKPPPSKPVTPYPHALLEAAIAGVLELLLKQRDAATPSAANVPESTLGVAAAPSPALTGDTTPGLAEQGILGLEPGSDAATPSPANVPESTPGAVVAPSPVLTGDTTPGLAQPGTLGLEPGSGATGLLSAKIPVLTPVLTVGKPQVLTENLNAGDSQQDTLGQKPALDITIPTSANIPEIIPGFMAKPSRLTSADIILGPSKQGKHIQKPRPGKVTHTSHNRPGLSAGVGRPSSLVSAEGATLGLPLRPQGRKPDFVPILPRFLPSVPQDKYLAPATSSLLLNGLQNKPQYRFNSARRFDTGRNTEPLTKDTDYPSLDLIQTLSHIPPGIPMDQYLAPISALLLNKLQYKPKYLFGSGRSFHTEDNTEPLTEDVNYPSAEGLQHLDDPHPRSRRSVEDLIAKYQLVKSVIDKYLNMSPRTQDFMVRQGVKLTAKMVNEILKNYGTHVNSWVSEKLSYTGLGSFSSLVGGEVEMLIRQLADGLQNYIETLPH